VLVAHAGVLAALVLAAGEGAGQRLVAYLVPADPAAGLPPVGELRNHLLRSVPEFMVPSVFVELADLPLTANGKVDRAALPAPDAVRPDLDGFLAPAGEVEESLAEIWRQVLGVDRVGARDNFFELGGHSLLATQVVSRIREVFEIELPLAALFDEPTIAQTAATITGAASGAEGDYEEFEI
jgi:acyl carrier protein